MTSTDLNGRLLTPVALLVALLVSVVSACGSEEDGAPAGRSTASSTPPSTRVTPSIAAPSAADVPEIVGEWRRLTTCRQRERALIDAGLGDYVAEQAVGDGFLLGLTDVSQIEDPSHPCRGAVSQRHSHFFTAEGQFGSRDESGAQVDDDDYRLLRRHRVVIGKVTFRYRIEGGRTLRLYPVLPDCVRHGCANAQWAVAVSYNGLPWRRVS
jgi:hypothetical protein